MSEKNENETVDMVPEKALGIYVAALEPKQGAAEKAASDANDDWGIIKDFKVSSKEEYGRIAKLAKDAKDKRKFLDEERKVSVTPLNEEVDRINAWYKPALDMLKKVAEHAERLLSNYTIEQQRKEQALLEQAKKEAEKVLATNPDVAGAQIAATSQLVQKAADAAPPVLTKAVNGVSAAPKPVFVFVIKDPLLLVTKHPELAMPDPKKVKEWVKTYGKGDKDHPVPAGLEVTEDVKTTVR